MPRWTVECFTNARRAQRQRWAKLLMDKISAIVQAGEDAGAGVKIMKRWEEKMQERFCTSEEIFSQSDQKELGVLDNRIKGREDFNRVKSTLNHLLVEIEMKAEDVSFRNRPSDYAECTDRTIFPAGREVSSVETCHFSSCQSRRCTLSPPSSLC